MDIKLILFSLVVAFASPAQPKPVNVHADTGGEEEVFFPRTRRQWGPSGAEIRTTDLSIMRRPALPTVPPPPPVEEQMDVCLVSDPDALNVEVIYQDGVDNHNMWLKNGPLPDCSSESEPVLLDSCRVCKRNDQEVEATCRRVRSSAELHFESDGKTLQKSCSSHDADTTLALEELFKTPPLQLTTPPTAPPLQLTTPPTAPPSQPDAPPPPLLSVGVIAGICVIAVVGVVGVVGLRVVRGVGKGGGGVEVGGGVGEVGGGGVGEVVVGEVGGGGVGEVGGAGVGEVGGAGVGGGVVLTLGKKLRSRWSRCYDAVPLEDQNGTDVGNGAPADNGHAPNGHAPNGHALAALC